jgi:CBS domain containing-hemolysin-like protein
MKLVFVLLALVLVRAVLVYKVYRSMPLIEIKRRARQRDKRAMALHKVTAFGKALEAQYWTFATAVTTILFIWAARTNWWLAAIVIVGVAWLAVWPKFAADGWAGGVAAFFAPFDNRVLAIGHPLFGWLAQLLPDSQSHTGMYDRNDLLEIFKKQNKQVDNRVPVSDLRIAQNALTFGDKTVGSVMTPRSQIKFVQANDLAGPVLTDELHKTGFSRFPVVNDSVKSANPQVIGTLYLNNLIGYDGHGKAKDLMKHDVYFINEDASLRQALNAFLKANHHLAIVINSFEETVGVLSLEDVLEQIIGKQIVDEFDEYENLRAVAAMKAKLDQAPHQEVKPEQTAETVVE